LDTNYQLDSNEKGQVYLHESNYGDYQKWNLIQLYDNVFKFKNKATNLFLTNVLDSQTSTIGYYYARNSNSRTKTTNPTPNYTLKTQQEDDSPKQNWLLLN